MKTPRFWRSRGVISTLLLPFSWIYGLSRFWRRRQARFAFSTSIPIICVGNLTAGGAGKTPVALHVGAWLRDKNIPAYFLTRGYGGSARGPLVVNLNLHKSSEVGDEALLLARVLPTIVAKDRTYGAKLAVRLGAQAIVMDDGFQNQSLSKTFSFVVMDGTYGLGNGRLLPAGPLRESAKEGLARAQALVVVGPVKKDIELPVTLPLLHAHTSPKKNSAEALKGKNVFAFCGIAHPQKFFDTLKSVSADIKGMQSFPDHHPFSESDLKKLAAKAQKLGAILVTTDKDAARLSSKWRTAVTTLDIELIFDQPDILDAMLTRAAGQRW